MGSQGRPRFLIVEDEFVIALILEDYLADIGFEAKWQADTLSDAIDIVATAQDIDGAILDVNLRGESVRPVAEALKARGVPFCFITGYGASAATGFPEAPVVGKPFDMETFQAVVRRMMAGRAKV
jgi:DNA-binding response OmpR family regulator